MNCNGAKSDQIEELKIVQNILLTQEAYSLSAFRYSFIIIGGLIIAYLTGKKDIISELYFIIFITITFVGFLYIQLIYREAFYKGLERSQYLQNLLRGENCEQYTPFYIFESFDVRKTVLPKKALVGDLRNPRFLLPNVILYALALIATFMKPQ